MRVTNSGTYEYCRWEKHQTESRVNFVQSIKTQSVQDYFQNTLAPLRQQFLNGEQPPGCNECYVMEQNNKVSGRQKQLLKIGVLESHFEKSLSTSPLKQDFDYSATNQGHTTRSVSDWQIDLGNYCNSSCIFCNPESSSMMATEFKKIGLIEQLPPTAWCNDSELVEKFVNDLTNNHDIRYLHFIGGETLITPAFKKILKSLVHTEQCKQVTIGLTTNLTLWSDEIAELLANFNQVNFGMSVETLTPVNDYVRWPGKLNNTKQYLDQWVAFAQDHRWLTQLRITPTCLTIEDLWTVYDYAWNNTTSVESCNFLYKPEFLRIGVLPQEYLQTAKNKIQHWIDQHPIDLSQNIVNTRDPNLARQQVVQDAQSYVNYLSSCEDESHRLPDLVNYLKTLEANRGNSILDYLPHYEDLLRSAGY